MQLTPFKYKIQDHFDKLADKRDYWRSRNSYYYEFQERNLRFLIPPGKRVLEVGCGTGELLSALKPSYGIGIDLSSRMINIAKEKFPELSFYHVDAEDSSRWPFEGPFDFIVLSDVLGLLEDVQGAFEQLRDYCTSSTRIVITYYNFVWEPVLKFGERLGFKMPQPNQNWLSPADIENLLFLADCETVKKESRLLVPKKIPGLSRFFELMGPIPIVNKFCLCHYLVARPIGGVKSANHKSVSVIIPCLNEKGNIEPAVQRVPQMGSHTEIIFVDGHSKDGTQEAIREVIEKFPDKDISFLVQDGKGKGDAVRKGFAHAKGDILMILDADLTVPPEHLPKFYRAIASGKAEFINGSRLVYPMEKEAMRLLNLFGNKFFGLIFSWLLNQRIKDTLCGTKVLRKETYNQIAENRSYFGEFDPFGDFDLLFGASKQNFKIIEIPIRYRARTYGETQISRFRHGFLLLQMCVFAARKLKLI